MQRRRRERADSALIANHKPGPTPDDRIRKFSEGHENGNFRRTVFPVKEDPVFRQLFPRKRFVLSKEFHLSVDHGGKRGRSLGAFEGEV